MLKKNISESNDFIEIENKYDVLTETKKDTNLNKACFSKTKDIAKLKSKNICSKNMERDLSECRKFAINNI